MTWLDRLRRAADGLRFAGEALSAVVYPPHCANCQEPLPVRSRVALCAPCYEALELNDAARCGQCDAPGANPCARCRAQPPPFARVRAPILYGGGGTALLLGAKFQQRLDWATALGELLVCDAEAITLVQSASCLVPVPLGRSRAVERGFNQSAVIARLLGRRLGAPVRHALRRVRDTQPQSALPAAGRADNVRAAFAGKGRLAGRVVLVDDVVTSTETARAAATALRAAGAAEVCVLAPLRAPLD